MSQIFTLFLILSTSIVSAQDSLSLVMYEGDKGTRHDIYIDISDAENNLSSIPISIIKGAKEGPVFTLISGVHGYEYPPIIATQALIQEISPDKLSGTLIIIPLANPSSFYGRSPFLNPQDDINLNRVFPGSGKGSITERIADFITNSIIPKSDVFIDIHGGDANEDLLPFICYYNNESKLEQTTMVKRLTTASGFKYVVSYPYTLPDNQKAKYVFKQAVQDGKVALSMECGKLGNVQKEAVELIKTGVYNMLAEMDMYGERSKMENEFININKQDYIRSKDQGFFESDYSAGDRIKKGAVVGYTKDPFGEIISEILAPTSGIILYKIGTPPINVGETIMCIGSTK